MNDFWVLERRKADVRHKTEKHILQGTGSLVFLCSHVARPEGKEASDALDKSGANLLPVLVEEDQERGENCSSFVEGIRVSTRNQAMGWLDSD